MKVQQWHGANTIMNIKYIINKKIHVTSWKKEKILLRISHQG